MMTHMPLDKIERKGEHEQLTILENEDLCGAWKAKNNEGESCKLSGCILEVEMLV